MKDFFSVILWVIYPYAMLLSFFVGTFVRLKFYPASVTAVSSEMLEKKKN
ncbi:hypothetical protein O209_04595 [Lactiplantibacillus plantarum WHE 92]|nr:hypothetical protein O209_04595 [Lactiplantibacillus plantarum WHE 92]